MNTFMPVDSQWECLAWETTKVSLNLSRRGKSTIEKVCFMKDAFYEQIYENIMIKINMYITEELKRGI